MKLKILSTLFLIPLLFSCNSGESIMEFSDFNQKIGNNVTHDQQQEKELYTSTYGSFVSSFNEINQNDEDLKLISSAKAEAELLLTGTVLPSFFPSADSYLLTKMVYASDIDDFKYGLATNEIIKASDYMKLEELKTDDFKANIETFKNYLINQGYTLSDSAYLNYGMQYYIQEGLFRFTTGTFNRIETNLIDNYQISSDGFTITVTLKDDIHYVNYKGEILEKISAYDFDDHNIYGAFYSVRVVDDKTIEYRFKEKVNSKSIKNIFVDNFRQVNYPRVNQGINDYKEMKFYGPYYISLEDDEKIVFKFNSSYPAQDYTLKNITITKDSSLDYYNRFISNKSSSVSLTNEYIKSNKLENLNDYFIKSRYMTNNSTSIARSDATLGINIFDGDEISKSFLQNRHFRLALLHSLNRKEINKDFNNGDNNKQNILSQKQYKKLSKDIQYGSYSFKKDMDYEDIIQVYLGEEVNVKEDDGWLNLELSKKHLDKAKEELNYKNEEITLYNMARFYIDFNDYGYDCHGRLINERLVEQIKTNLSGIKIKIVKVNMPQGDFDFVLTPSSYIDFRTDNSLPHRTFTKFYLDNYANTYDLLKSYVSNFTDLNNKLYVYNGFYTI